MVEIRPLSPAELDKFLEFMEGSAFETNPQWSGCYCQFYLNKPGEETPAESRFEGNRQKACDRIKAGTMQGYLAFDGDAVVGWMAANKANNFKLLPETDESAARVLCFVIDPEHQGKGVATQLLNFSIEDLRARGFKTLEAAPRSDDSFASDGYRGKLSSFLKAGFEQVNDLDEKHVLVRRQLTD